MKQKLETTKLTRLTLALLATFGFGNFVSAEQNITDAQIAAIVVTANQVDIDAGIFAKTRTRNRKVIAFAETMVTDHTSVNKSAADLVAKLGVTPEDNPTSRSLLSGGYANLSKLSLLTGRDFDRAYIKHEVDYHQQVIDAIDNALLPNAKNAKLKALIKKVRPALVAHLSHAENLYAAYK